MQELLCSKKVINIYVLTYALNLGDNHTSTASTKDLDLADLLFPA